MDSTALLLFHIISAVATTVFAVAASLRLIRIFRSCGYQTNSYLKAIYETHIKNYLILFAMAIEYIAVSLTAMEGVALILVWIALLVLEILEGILFLKRIKLSREEFVYSAYDICVISATGILAGVMAALSLYAGTAIMSFVILFIPVLISAAGAISRPLSNQGKNIK